jgi:demethylspheroidene O-methyltransferase
MRRWRDRLLSSPEFQRWTLRLPGFRWIARRRMRELFDLCSGFVYSQVLLACIRLDLFGVLASSPRTSDELAALTRIDRNRLDRLLDAAASLRLIEQRGADRWGLGPLGAALRGNPSVALMIEHHGAFYADLLDPVGLLQGDKQETELRRFWAYSKNADARELKPAQTRAYSELMAASQVMIAEQVLAAYSLKSHRRHLDIGGGAGAFALAAMRRYPALESCVFDLPSVADIAAKRFTAEQLGSRATCVGGDFINDPLPKGADLVSLVRILHDHDDEAVASILRACRNAIAADGVLLIAEPMLGTRGAEPVSAAYFGFYLMAMGQGRPRDIETLTAFLEDAGFDRIERHSTSAPLLTRVLTARPARSQAA